MPINNNNIDVNRLNLCQDALDHKQIDIATTTQDTVVHTTQHSTAEIGMVIVAIWLGIKTTYLLALFFRAIYLKEFSLAIALVLAGFIVWGVWYWFFFSFLGVSLC